MTKMKLTNAELLVMKCIWDTPEDMVLSQVVSMVNGRYGKGWRPQTVSTYLAHLVQKKFLKMTRQGKIYTYHPLIPEDVYRTEVMADFVDFWGTGSAASFLEAYYRGRKPEAGEIEELRSLIDSLEKEQNSEE